MPFPVDDAVPVKAGDDLIVVTAHPAGMDKEIDQGVPVVQGCKVSRAPHILELDLASTAPTATRPARRPAA